MSQKAKIIQFPRFTKLLNKHLYQIKMKDKPVTEGVVKVFNDLCILVTDEMVIVTSCKIVLENFEIIEDITDQFGMMINLFKLHVVKQNNE